MPFCQKEKPHSGHWNNLKQTKVTKIIKNKKLKIYFLKNFSRRIKKKTHEPWTWVVNCALKSGRKPLCVDVSSICRSDKIFVSSWKSLMRRQTAFTLQFMLQMCWFCFLFHFPSPNCSSTEQTERSARLKVKVLSARITQLHLRLLTSALSPASGAHDNIYRSRRSDRRGEQLLRSNSLKNVSGFIENSQQWF